MLHLIDGYNVTMRADATSGLSKEGQRDALAHRLSVRGRRLLGAGTIVCVFDARETLVSSGEQVGEVRLVFAPDADSEIVRRAAAAGGQVSVVTDDLRLRARIAQDVGRHISFRDTSCIFGEDEPGAVTGRERPRDPGLSREDRAAITEELAREWLVDEDG